MTRFALLLCLVAGCGSSSDSFPSPGDDDDDTPAADADPLAPDGSPQPIADAGPPADAIALVPADDGTCALADDTYLSGTVTDGCALIERDASPCLAARQAAGLSGFWLRFSCRVSLSKQGGSVHLVADGQPDYRSAYFQNANPCHRTEAGTFLNPNRIATQAYVADIPLSPAGGAEQTNPGAIGFALNGVALFDNHAAPGDDIYQEAMTFDACAAHPNMTGTYHYHSEPVSLSSADDRLIGVMRDGHPVYGRFDAGGVVPTLDQHGGHTGTTPDSATPIYHYHVNEQTSTSPGTSGQKQWFISKGMYHSSPGTCSGCM